MTSVPGVPWNEQLGRILMSIGIASKNPLDLLEYGDYLHKHDAARASSYGDSGLQDLLSRPGGAEALPRLVPGMTPPTPIPVERLQGTDPADPTRAFNTIAAPSKPGDPTTEGYALPLTPVQIRERKLDEGGTYRNPAYSETRTFDPKTGEVRVERKEREQDLHTADEIMNDPYLSRRINSGELMHTAIGKGPGGVTLYALTPDPAFEAGRKTSAQEGAREPYTIAREERNLGYKYPEAITDRGVDPNFPGTKRVDATLAQDKALAKDARAEDRAIATQNVKVRSAREQINVLKDLVLGHVNPDTGMREGGPLRQEAFTGMADRGAYVLQQGAKVLGGDQQLRDIERTKKILRSSLAKALADQSGNLAIQEQEAIDHALSGSYDTMPSAVSNFQILDELLAAKERAAEAGRTITAPRSSSATPTPNAEPTPGGGYSRAELEAEARRRGLIR